MCTSNQIKALVIVEFEVNDVICMMRDIISSSRPKVVEVNPVDCRKMGMAS